MPADSTGRLLCKYEHDIFFGTDHAYVSVIVFSVPRAFGNSSSAKTQATVSVCQFLPFVPRWVYSIIVYFGLQQYS